MRGELPSQEQTTCNGNSRWSSVCLLARIEWNNRGQPETPARRSRRVISVRRLEFFQPIAVLAAARYCGAATTYSFSSPKISKASSSSHSIFRAYFLPNGIHNPGELIRRQLAFLPTRWDMPCRINLSRIFRASSGANGSLPFLPWAWPAFWTKGQKSLRTLATQALSFSPD